MALPASTANWHWKNKNITRWGKEWFERELPTLSVTGDVEGEVVSISRVCDVEGDIELGQRKSKLITIYDCSMELEWEGVAQDGTKVEGKLSIPEVSHEITLDGLSDYQFSWKLTTASSPTVDALFKLAKTRLPTALETKFAEFPSAIIETHGKDLQVAGSGDPSRSGTPVQSATPASASGSQRQPASVKSGVKVKPVNTTAVTVDANFMASAEDLFSLLTDENRIPSWTRAPAKSTPSPGAEYSLFGGGVSGKYVSLLRHTQIIQTWALQSPTWPSDHTATMTTSLAQSSDSTKVTFRLEGVPSGMEEEIKRNVEGYYIHGLKSIGYVQLVYTESHSSSPPTKPKRPRRSRQTKSSTWTWGYAAAALATAVVLLTALSIRYLPSNIIPPLSRLGSEL